MSSRAFKLGAMASIIDKYLFVGATSAFDSNRLHWFEETSEGVFTKLGAPNTPPTGTVRAVTVNPAGTIVVASHDTAPYVSAYSINRTTKTLTKLADLTGLTANSRACHFSPDGNYLFVGMDASPFCRFYSVSGTTFTQLSNPTLSGNPSFVQWNRNSDWLAVAYTSVATPSVFTRSGSTLTSRTLTGINTTGLTNFNGCSWSPDNKVIFSGNGTSDVSLQAWTASGTTLTRIDQNLIGLAYSNARQCQFSAGGALLLVGEENSPKMTVRKVSNSGFINPLQHNVNIQAGQLSVGANSSILAFEPDNTILGLRMSKDLKYIATASPNATNGENLTVNRYAFGMADRLPITNITGSVCVEWWPSSEH